MLPKIVEYEPTQHASHKEAPAADPYVPAAHVRHGSEQNRSSPMHPSSGSLLLRAQATSTSAANCSASITSSKPWNAAIPQLPTISTVQSCRLALEHATDILEAQLHLIGPGKSWVHEDEGSGPGTLKGVPSSTMRVEARLK
jgi:hypothetical protein